MIRNPETGEEVMRITDLSRWLYSRAMFPIAEIIQAHRFREISEAAEVKKFFFNLIVKYRRMKNKGVFAIFKKNRFDYYSNFARIGQGSLGGKGRGLTPPTRRFCAVS